jgi:hypothetical protein
MRYTVYALAIIATYSFLQWRGVDLLPSSSRFLIPSSVRSSPGGYRTYHSYHGFHGGK